MQKGLIAVLAVMVAISAVSCAPAKVQTPATAASAPAVAASATTKPADKKAAEYAKSAEKRAKEALAVLALKDPAKEKKVHDMIVAYVPTLMAWQDANRATIKALWDQWKKARSDEKDEVKAEGITKQIDAVYATFKPQHDKFWSKLGEVLTPEQVELVKDRYTVKKTPVTYNAYLEIFPVLSDKQKAYTLEYLKAAREEALDAGTMDEKSDFYKKYKIIIESRYARDGLDPRKYRQEFSAKQKAAAAAKKAATQPATQSAAQAATQPAEKSAPKPKAKPTTQPAG